MLFGITGSTGSGKSYVSDIFRKNGFFIIDADKIGHKIIKRGEPAYFELKEHFGDDILLDNGEINRKRLGEIVFSDSGSLAFLNSATHPRIREKIYKTAAEKGGIVGVDGALLFECEVECSPIIAVIADKDTRIGRITRRDGISREIAEKRIASQKSDDFYRQSCDFIIENNGGDIENDIKKIIDRLRESV